MLPAQDAPPPDAGSASQGLGTPVVEIADLEFRYGTQDTPLLRLERLEVAAAERLLIVGPSGCGKSTLMSLLAGVLVANRGRVAILGTDWRALSPSARDRRRGDHVGYLFQQFNLLDWLPVLDNVCLPCRFSARHLRADHGLGAGALYVATLRNPQGLAIAHANMAHESFIGCDHRKAAKGITQRDGYDPGHLRQLADRFNPPQAHALRGLTDMKHGVEQQLCGAAPCPHDQVGARERLGKALPDIVAQALGCKQQER